MAVTDDVLVFAQREACPGGVAVGVRVEEDQLRPADVRGRFVVNRWAVAPKQITRAYQPWHVDVEPDPSRRWRGYLHPNMPVTLRNLVGAEMPNALAAAENDHVFIRSLQLVEHPVAQSFDLLHLRAIHDRLFQEVFPWAGEIRTVNLGRPGGPAFVPWEQVEESFGDVADHVARSGRLAGAARADFVNQAAGVYEAVNTIHAFREGNGRTQREWMSDLARSAGYQLDWDQVRGAENDRVSRLAREGDSIELRAMVDRITSPLEPGSAEDQRAARFAALLRRARAPISEIGTAGPPTPESPSRSMEPPEPGRGYER